MDEVTVSKVEAEEAPESPLRAIYPGEPVQVAGRTIWVKPWGVKALMTEVPGMVGGLMGRLAPVFEAVRAKEGSEAVLKTLMESAGAELVDFAAKTVGLSLAETEAMTAGEFVSLLRAVMRQNKDFFVQLAGLYGDLGKPIESALGATGSQS